MAWHWIGPVAGTAQAAGVLEPGGRVTLFWHTFTLPPALTDALAVSEIVAETGAAVDAMGGCFTMGYATVAITARRV
jgi:hypothetical protein